MIDAPQAAVTPAPSTDVGNAGAAGRSINILVPAKQGCVETVAENDIVVCGRRDNEQFRLRSLPPPPPSDGLLSRPLRARLAPGVSIGFQKGGGFGLKAEFGPGKKTDEEPK